nr:hypothetical protein [Haladaptatus sp. R4]
MTETFEIDDYYDLTLVSDLSLSPDGTRIAFVADEFDRTADDRRTSLFAVPADGGEKPYRLSRASDAGGPKWSPDARNSRFSPLATRTFPSPWGRERARETRTRKTEKRRTVRTTNPNRRSGCSTWFGVATPGR